MTAPLSDPIPFVPRDEYERDQQRDAERFAKIEQQISGQGDEIRQIKDLIINGIRDLRNDVQALKSLSARFVQGLAAGAGISYAFYQAVHAALQALS